MAPEHITSALREAVVRRANGCFEYCRSHVRFAPQAISIEHIIPRSLGGATTLVHLAFACQGCNNHKYTKTHGTDPLGGAVVPLFHPRRDTWTEHFIWSDDYSLMIGRTPSGRATVEALRLNHPGVVGLRRVLFEVGEHPR